MEGIVCVVSEDEEEEVCAVSQGQEEEEEALGRRRLWVCEATVGSARQLCPITSVVKLSSATSTSSIAINRSFSTLFTTISVFHC